MQVHPINNSLNFKSVYLSDIAGDFSNNQLKVADKIKREFKLVDGDDLEGRTYENKFKKKYGLDFIIEPAGKSVSLYGIRGLKKHRTGTNSFYTYDRGECFRIGKYDESNPFNIEDVEPKNKHGFWANFAAIAVFIGLPIITAGSLTMQKAKQSADKTKTLIENTDTIKATVKDTTKILKMFVK